MPAMPGARVAMTEAEIVLGTQEARLNRPPQSSGGGQFGKCGA